MRCLNMRTLSAIGNRVVASSHCKITRQVLLGYRKPDHDSVNIEFTESYSLFATDITKVGFGALQKLTHLGYSEITTDRDVKACVPP